MLECRRLRNHGPHRWEKSPTSWPMSSAQKVRTRRVSRPAGGRVEAPDPRRTFGSPGLPFGTPGAGRPAVGPLADPERLEKTRRPAVILRMSTLFLRTLREDPADAEVPSHRLLVRAG